MSPGETRKQGDLSAAKKKKKKEKQDTKHVSKSIACIRIAHSNEDEPTKDDR